MKKIIEVRVQREEIIKVEVEFPIYRKHDLIIDYGESIIYTRTEEDMTAYSIHHNINGKDESFEIEIEPGRRFNFTGDANYLLGRGQYASSAHEFNSILNKALDFLRSFQRNSGD